MKSGDSGIGYELSRVMLASPQVVFDALTNPAVLKRIWGVQNITVDARVGGQATAEFAVQDQDWSFTLTYSELDRQRGRMHWITRFRSFPTKETRVAVQLTSVREGTHFTVQMRNFESTDECDANKQAWHGALTTLADIVERSAK